jgi:DNA adenine methylase
MYEPAVKWSGSKRTQAEKILGYFPREIETYYEPFCGGASVLRRLLSNEEIEIHRYMCSDLNAGLIELWKEIKEHPDKVSDWYEKLWKELNQDENKERKKEYFAKVRDRYNQEGNPLDFMFIMRTTTNGMPRYNKDGQFNNSFHVTRNGIEPSTLRDIVAEWSELLRINQVEFLSCSYTEICPDEKDFLYLDPPYYNTKGMYYGTIDYDEFFKWLRGVSCGYALSFDGKAGTDDFTFAVPEDLYSKHEYLESGNSSFRRTIGKTKDTIVYESLYIK